MKHVLRRKQPRLSLKEAFLRMARMTTPHGHEPYCWPLLPLDEVNCVSEIDRFNNVHIFVGESRIMWSSHLDTACAHAEVVRFQEEDGIITTDGTTILGADCKTGAAIMRQMILHGVPGWYVFHAGEERGCIGARGLAGAVDEWLVKPQIAIAFDRHSFGSIITFQRGQRCCSEEFSKALGEVLGDNTEFKGRLAYKSDPGGSFTDTACYTEIIPEVTNISVGYRAQHTNRESQDMPYAEALLEAILQNHQRFEDLPAKRDPSEKEWKTYGKGTYSWGKANKKKEPDRLGIASENETKKQRKQRRRQEKVLLQTGIHLRGKGTEIRFTNGARKTIDHEKVIRTKGAGDHFIRTQYDDGSRMWSTLDRQNIHFCTPTESDPDRLRFNLSAQPKKTGKEGKQDIPLG